MLEYLERKELRISEPVTMMINDCLLPGITLASVRSSNSPSFCCSSSQARCDDVVTGTLRRLQGRKAGQCRLHGYSPTEWWLGKAMGMAWNKIRGGPLLSSWMPKSLFHHQMIHFRFCGCMSSECRGTALEAASGTHVPSTSPLLQT